MESETKAVNPSFPAQEALFGRAFAFREGLVPQVGMCRNKDGRIFTDERQVIERWKQHFDKHVNDAEAEY